MRITEKGQRCVETLRDISSIKDGSSEAVALTLDELRMLMRSTVASQ